ncbi:hypothetical protein FRC04_005252 [Tulasnella sp. 424]|nr:hypothetical protein FRC04_005252 [Tulasnella sp. 424]KAG8962791.1 hypothetical protein FRC05_005115 [Tulasnella sp. 425]
MATPGDSHEKLATNGTYPAANLEAARETGQSQGSSRKWLKVGVPIAVVIVVGAVLGGVLGSRASKKSSPSSGSSTGEGVNGASGLESVKTAVGMFATTTNSHTVPVYPSTTNAAAFGVPTFIAQPGDNPEITWNKDTFQPASPAPTNVRPDRPRLIAPAYKWDQLPNFVASDPYMKDWNDTIMADAQKWQAMDPVPYEIDGGLGKSGVLDVARQVKQRIKAFAYAYRVTKQTMWVDRAWKELYNASGQSSASFGEKGNNWNTAHFLDVAEFTAAFAIGYDWLYDAWTDQQKETIRTAIVTLGLQYGIQVYANNAAYGWWTTAHGNWNCVCNGGLTMGALAILGDDTTNTASSILNYTIPNAVANCAQGVTSDGSWTETPNYWYFGTTSHAEMASSLLTATGSAYGLMDSNPSFSITGFYHMYVSGNQQLFDYGDHGPNKYSATANAMFLHSTQFKTPEYALFQRDRPDAAEPWSMFWYDPAVSGAFWNGLALDHYFEDTADSWASMRTSWTDINGWYVAMKGGKLTGHASHGNLDGGDFVLDHDGVRWAGELGSGDYDADGYFDPETQESGRWLYYRTRTEGQNTLVVDQQNQIITAVPTCKFESTATHQESSTVFDVPSDSTAMFTTDLTTNYGGTSIKRGVRFLAGRTRVLLQDDITNAAKQVQWRMHTNATVAVDGSMATLSIDDKKMYVHILNAPSGVAFETLPAQRYAQDPALPAGMTDQPNPGVTVLAITLQPGTYNLQVLFDPTWSGQDAAGYTPPALVPIDQWSATSHG